MSAKSEIEKLRREVERHNRLYHVEAQPEITDYDFDQMLRQLQELEAKHPELADPNSPSSRVGGQPLVGEFKTVVHDPPMLSIENAYSIEELREWDERVRRGLGREAVEYEAELKIDGVSIDLLYENGALARAATRGDGARGDDVTQNVRTVRSLPLRIDTKVRRLGVRGEIYISKVDFAKLNAEIEEAGLRGAEIEEAGLRGAEIGEAGLRGAEIEESGLRGAEIGEAGLRGGGGPEGQ